MKSKEPGKDRTNLENGYYIISKVYETALNPKGVIMGGFGGLETAKEQFNKFTFLRRMLNPKLIKIEDNEIK